MNGNIRKHSILRIFLSILLPSACLLSCLLASGAVMNYTPSCRWRPSSCHPVFLQKDPETGLLLIRARLNGKPCTLILDTGTTHTAFDERYIRNNFPNQPLSSVTLKPGTNIQTTPRAFAVTSLEVGSSVQQSFLGIVLDMSSIRTALGTPVDGILGMNSLGTAPFLLSASRGIFQWLPGASKPPRDFLPIPHRTNAMGSLTLPCRANGRSLDFLVDSGASFSSVPARHWPPGTSVSLQTADINSGIVRSEQARRGVPCDIRFGNALFLPQMEPLLTENDIPCILGLDMLKRFDMIVDMNRDMIRIRPVPPQQDHP